AISEAEAQDGLEIPRASGLKDRSKTAARASGAEHQVEHRRRFPKQRSIDEADGIGEVRVIEQIERFDAELERAMLPEAELAPQGKVDLAHAETCDGISSEVALLDSSSDRKHLSVQFVSVGRQWIVDPYGATEVIRTIGIGDA